MVPRVLIVPLVAFDSNKNRLGYGGGYYDRTISFLEKKGEVFKIGVGFDEQEVKNLPFYQYDKKLDVVVTPSRLIT
jgi:5-formyltetrahydrofolate cyclo-ligase